MKKKIIFIAVLLAILVCFGCSKESVKMIEIPGQNFRMSETEITQAIYEKVMGENPSDIDQTYEMKRRTEAFYEGERITLNFDYYPVNCVSFYDAIYFCNKLSEKDGFEPVYSYLDSNSVDIIDNYKPHRGMEFENFIKKQNETRNGVPVKEIKGLTINPNANGYRLPTVDEWVYAAKGGEDYKYAGSDDINEIAWYIDNSSLVLHPVAEKKTNAYGLYDMTGNVLEWCWDEVPEYDIRRTCGGYFRSRNSSCLLSTMSGFEPKIQHNSTGFRVVRSVL